MSDLKRIILWLLVLLVPGGVVLLPVLVLDASKNGFWRAGTRHA
jgi:hypothetical protein